VKGPLVLGAEAGVRKDEYEKKLIPLKKAKSADNI
jgi:hypothetical protein